MFILEVCKLFNKRADDCSGASSNQLLQVESDCTVTNANLDVPRNDPREGNTDAKFTTICTTECYTFHLGTIKTRNESRANIGLGMFSVSSAHHLLLHPSRCYPSVFAWNGTYDPSDASSRIVRVAV